jgi:peptidoglycan hydrolase CwlO-like protein
MYGLARRTASLISLVTVYIIITALLAAPATGEDLDKKYRDLQRQIREQKKMLETAKAKEESFIKQIENVNKRLDTVSKALSIQKKKVRRTKDRIIIVKKDIKSFNKMLDRQRSYLKRKLSSMQRHGDNAANVIAVIVSSENFSQMVRNMHYLQKIAEYDYRQIQEYKENLRKLELKKIKLNDLYVQYRAEEKELSTNENLLKEERKHKKILLASIRKQKKGYRKMLRELTDASNSVRKMLEEEIQDTGVQKRDLYQGR